MTMSVGGVAAVAQCAGPNGACTITYGPPHITSVMEIKGGTADVQPTNLTTAGGGSLRIIGTSFYPTGSQVQIQVQINGLTCQVSSASYTQLVCTYPSLGSGQYSVTVSVNGVQSDNQGSVTYGNPVVTGITPTAVAQGGGTQLMLTGWNLASSAVSTTVSVGGQPCGIVSKSGSSSVACTTASVGSGSLPVVLQQNGVAANPLTVTSVGPTLNSVSYEKGGALDTQGNTKLYLQCSNLAPPGQNPNSVTVTLTADFTATKTCQVQTKTATYVECITPWNPSGTYQVQITADGATTNSLPVQYAAPIINFVPSKGVYVNQSDITINGYGFLQGYTTVLINDLPCTNVQCSGLPSMSLTCRPPIMNPLPDKQFYDVVVSGGGDPAACSFMPYQTAVQSCFSRLTTSCSFYR